MGDDRDDKRDELSFAASVGKVAKIEAKASGPGLFTRFFAPSAMSRVTDALIARLKEKIANDETLDLSDLELTSAVAPKLAGVVRLRYIEQIAYNKLPPAILTSESPLMLPGPGTPHDDVKRQAEAWYAKFQRDGETVTDPMLAEIYARLLRSQAQQPGTCSLLTLGVLRSLDSSIAQLFDLACSIAINGQFLLANTQTSDARPAKIKWSQILDLEDAGLITSALSRVSMSATLPNALMLELPGYAILVENPPKWSPPAYRLTLAGRELAAIADSCADESDAVTIAKFCKAHVAPHVAWAKTPGPQWSAATAQDVTSLPWNELGEQ